MAGVCFPVSPLPLQSQSLASGHMLKIPITFARQHLQQALLLEPQQACSVPAELLMLLAASRDPTLVQQRVRLPEGLLVSHYAYTRPGITGSFEKSELRVHSFSSSHPLSKRLCDRAWYFVGVAMSGDVLQLMFTPRLPAAEMQQKVQELEQRKRSRELTLQLQASQALDGDNDLLDLQPQESFAAEQPSTGWDGDGSGIAAAAAAEGDDVDAGQQAVKRSKRWCYQNCAVAGDQVWRLYDERQEAAAAESASGSHSTVSPGALDRQQQEEDRQQQQQRRHERQDSGLQQQGRQQQQDAQQQDRQQQAGKSKQPLQARGKQQQVGNSFKQQPEGRPLGRLLPVFPRHQQLQPQHSTGSAVSPRAHKQPRHGSMTLTPSALVGGAAVANNTWAPRPNNSTAARSQGAAADTIAPAASTASQAAPAAAAGAAAACGPASATAPAEQLAAAAAVTGAQLPASIDANNLALVEEEMQQQPQTPQQARAPTQPQQPQQPGLLQQTQPQQPQQPLQQRRAQLPPWHQHKQQQQQPAPPFAVAAAGRRPSITAAAGANTPAAAAQPRAVIVAHNNPNTADTLSNSTQPSGHVPAPPKSAAQHSSGSSTGGRPKYTGDEWHPWETAAVLEALRAAEAHLAGVAGAAVAKAGSEEEAAAAAAAAAAALTQPDAAGQAARVSPVSAPTPTPAPAAAVAAVDAVCAAAPVPPVHRPAPVAATAAAPSLCLPVPQDGVLLLTQQLHEARLPGVAAAAAARSPQHLPVQVTLLQHQPEQQGPTTRQFKALACMAGSGVGLCGAALQAVLRKASDSGAHVVSSVTGTASAAAQGAAVNCSTLPVITLELRPA